MAKKEYVKPQFNIVEVDPTEEDGSARYRLPYGIAKGLGLNTDGMTPRQVWDMLKGRGIDPEKAYDELEKKAKTEIKKEQPKEVDAQREVYKKTITQSKAFSTLKKEVKDKIEKSFETLSSEQLAIVSKFVDRLQRFTNGSGECGWGGSYIRFDQNISGGDLDKELGYDFDATTFYHEYGHLIDNMVAKDKGGNLFSQDSTTVKVDEDALFMFNEIIKEGGGTKPLKDFNRIGRDQVQAIYKGLGKITGEDQIWGYKSRKEFGYVDEPSKPYQTPEQARAKYGEYSYQMEVERWERYNQQMKAYQEAQANGTNEQAIKKHNQYLADMREHNKPLEAQRERYAIITDFMGMYSNNRIDPYKNGFYGHKGTYNKTMATQSETWAEYFSFKMTNDKKGLDIMKKYLPKTYQAFEKKYNELKEK